MNLNQVTIPVTDIELSISFYQLFGLKLIVKTTEYARFECPDGDATFSLHKVSAVPCGEAAWIYFEEENLDNIASELIEKGIKFEEMPNDKPWLWREARLKDPSGNQLILYYAGANRKYPPWRLC